VRRHGAQGRGDLLEGGDFVGLEHQPSLLRERAAEVSTPVDEAGVDHVGEFGEGQALGLGRVVAQAALARTRASSLLPKWLYPFGVTNV